ncbi:MAG: leucine-rich repeat domain-containing protein [Clostridiales bacterium]|nr:leucine-rich repeat domain-containing protein [Clostridiales bacterium]
MFNKDKTKAVQCPVGCGLTSYTIPDSVTCIGFEAFRDSENLTSIVIPDGVISIDDYAFFGCDSLESIAIPDSVTSIGVLAFQNCENLGNITISENLTCIGEDAFRGTAYMSDLANWEDDVLYIGNYLLCCSNVDATIREGTTLIADYAFAGSSISSITIPDSVTIIGKSAFRYCTSLSNIILPDNITSIGSEAFITLHIIMMNQIGKIMCCI